MPACPPCLELWRTLARAIHNNCLRTRVVATSNHNKSTLAVQIQRILTSSTAQAEKKDAPTRGTKQHGSTIFSSSLACVSVPSSLFGCMFYFCRICLTKEKDFVVGINKKPRGMTYVDEFNSLIFFCQLSSLLLQSSQVFITHQ